MPEQRDIATTIDRAARLALRDGAAVTFAINAESDAFALYLASDHDAESAGEMMGYFVELGSQKRQAYLMDAADGDEVLATAAAERVAALRSR